MSYIILRGRCLNIHAPTEDKSDDVKDRFNEQLEQVFDKFPNYHMKILLGDFNAEVGREDIFKPTIGNKSLHEINNDNGVRVGNFTISKFLLSKVRHSYTVTFINSLGCLLMERRTTKLKIF
jgi:hypothetical protein